MERMPRQNNNRKGIIYILLAMMVFSVQDGIMKHIYNFVVVGTDVYVTMGTEN